MWNELTVTAPYQGNPRSAPGAPGGLVIIPAEGRVLLQHRPRAQVNPPEPEFHLTATANTYDNLIEALVGALQEVCDFKRDNTLDLSPGGTAGVDAPFLHYTWTLHRKEAK